MARTISFAESWEKVYQAFTQINFTAFDYDTIKQSLVEYIRIYFPESFNDFIENSEFILLIETFAYIGEQLIYRVDVGSHENFIDVAQRKQSVLRLAKLISYKATRNLPARGTLKVTSVTTTQDVYDSRGNSLKGRKIVWNDVNNTLWRDQFIAVMNAASSTSFGTVSPSDRVQVDNVLYELYSLNNQYSTNGVVKYNVTVNGSGYPMEIVSSTLSADGPIESRPDYNSAMTYLYATDGFGDDSPSTGFFVSTKQGTLQNQRTTFDGITPNQTFDITVNNINDIDFWVNNVDPDTNAILNTSSTTIGRSGEWAEIDTTTAQNVIFSYNNNRNVYELESLENDQVRVIFGDGQFSNIPNGTFDLWYRVSANEDVSIPLNAVVNQQVAVSYIDDVGNTQNLQMTVSLIANVQNASASEDIEHIRSNAPSVYYTQNRMVNGADYNEYFGKDPSILKVKAINRTYVGDSKYSYWHDASSTYENVKIFGNDLIALFNDVTNAVQINSPLSTATLFANYIAPILSTPQVANYMIVHKTGETRRTFTDAESTQIQAVLFNNAWPDPVYINYTADTDTWSATTSATTDPFITVNAIMNGNSVVGWTVINLGYDLQVQSPTTKFWDANDASLISYETLSPARDQVVVLQANVNNYGTGLLTDNLELLVNGIVVDSNGLPDITKLSVSGFSAVDSNLTGSALVQQLVDPSWTFAANTQVPITLTLPVSYVKGADEIMVQGILDAFWTEDPTVDVGESSNVIVLNAIAASTITVYKLSYVYYTRATSADAFAYTPYTTAVVQGYALEQLGAVSTEQQLYNRVRGRDQLNFLWTHETPMYNLVDPSMTNIHDVFIVQKGYYNDFNQWLLGTLDEPVQPTPLQLRSDYSSLLTSKMLSDTVVFHPGNLKLIIGDKSDPHLRAQLLVIKNPRSTLTDSQIKISVVQIVQSFFDISDWNFGDTFYFTEMAAQIHSQMPADISTVVMVPLYPNNYFGDMFQVNIDEDEIVQADIGIEDIVVTTSLNSVNLNQY